MSDSKRPMTNAERSTRCRQRALASGSQRIDVVTHDQAAIAALAELTRQHGSRRAAVEHALRVATGR